MAASVNDYFRKVSSSASVRPTPAYLTGSGKTLAASSITVSTTTGWATDTGVDVVIYEKDTVDPTKPKAGTVTTWKATISGTTLNGLTIEGGTDRAYTAGENTVVLMTPTAGQMNDLVTGILTHADQDGTLKAGAVDNAAVLASDVVTTAKILDSNVTTAKIATSAVTPNKLATGAAEAVVATSESTAVQTYGDNLATVGPSVTVTIGANGLALVNIYSFLNNVAANSSSFVGINISGATTIAAADTRSIQYQAYANNAGTRASATLLYTGLTPGSTTFKMQYRVDGNSGSFIDRRIAVTPL